MFISGLVIFSAQARDLASFYRDVLGLPLEASTHGGDVLEHYECELGDVHFAVHPAEGRPITGASAIKIAFSVRSIRQIELRLARFPSCSLTPIRNRGFAQSAVMHDPEGNQIELTELSERWLDYLSSRPAELRDVVVHCRLPDKVSKASAD